MIIIHQNLQQTLEGVIQINSKKVKNKELINKANNNINIKKIKNRI